MTPEQDERAVKALEALAKLKQEETKLKQEEEVRRKQRAIEREQNRSLAWWEYDSMH